MGMAAENEDDKSRLAAQICDISSRATACHHRKSPFIDWYLVLRIDENADMNGIKKQYHKLALQLHPDKNKHSKAETAFKLVSEAYFWLSDGARRAAFDRKRKAISCTECITTTPHTKTRKTCPNRTQMRKLRARLKDEANIIERILLANASVSRTRRSQQPFGTKPELPVFNPSDYYQQKGPPQQRTLDRDEMNGLKEWFGKGNRCLVNERTTSGSPVFENRSDRASFTPRRTTSTRGC